MRKTWNAIGKFFWNHPVLEDIVIALIVLAVITLLAVAICLPLHNADVQKYNNGICSCGGHYEYSQAVGHRMGSTYIYTCDRCRTPIEIDYIP